MLDLSRATVQRLLREGVLTSLKVRGRRLVELASITAFITREKERPADKRAPGVSRHDTISTGSFADLSSGRRWPGSQISRPLTSCTKREFAERCGG